MHEWQRSEKKDAKLFHTKQQRGSGNQTFYPTDSTSDTLAVETKHTNTNSFTITKAKWTKLCNETADLDAKDGRLRTPILSIHLGDMHLVVLDVEDYKKLEEFRLKSEHLYD
jgi:hypothetical protein